MGSGCPVGAVPMGGGPLVTSEPAASVGARSWRFPGSVALCWYSASLLALLTCSLLLPIAFLCRSLLLPMTEALFLVQDFGACGRRVDPCLEFLALLAEVRSSVRIFRVLIRNPSLSKLCLPQLPRSQGCCLRANSRALFMGPETLHTGEHFCREGQKSRTRESASAAGARNRAHGRALLPRGCSGDTRAATSATRCSDNTREACSAARGHACSSVEPRLVLNIGSPPG